MTVARNSTTIRVAEAAPREAAAAHSLPPWVFAELDGAPRQVVSRTDGRSIEWRHSAQRSLVTVRVRDANCCPPLDLQHATLGAYRDIADVLRDLPARHPIRFWNFIPGIGDAAGGGLDRYMVFNAGRFAAFREWFGDVSEFDRCVATSTGVGHDAGELVIHVLCADRPGRHVMNPRQIAPRCYSRRYGPCPPCFARATVVENEEGRGATVLIGGTAAVRGECSIGGDDLEAQMGETLHNLEWLLCNVESMPLTDVGHGPRSMAAAARAFESLRVYYRRPTDLPALRTAIGGCFGHLPDVEFLRCHMCRPELLVEIEGAATVGADVA